LQLQQILFFKELGLSLKQIQTVLGRNDFDQLAALESHRQALSRDWEKMGELIKTVDSTIQHLKGQKKMNDKEMFKGFSEVTIGAGAESYFEAEVILGKSIKNPRAEKLERSQREDTIKKAHGSFLNTTRSWSSSIPALRRSTGRSLNFTSNIQSSESSLTPSTRN
jgi:DNA-binding transcriptional MerR regulator